MEGIFLEELSVLKWENCFCLLLMECNFMFSADLRLNFVGQSVLYSTAYLSDRYQNYLTRPADRRYFRKLIDLLSKIVTYTRYRKMVKIEF